MEGQRRWMKDFEKYRERMVDYQHLTNLVMAFAMGMSFSSAVSFLASNLIWGQICAVVGVIGVAAFTSLLIFRRKYKYWLLRRLWRKGIIGEGFYRFMREGRGE